MGHCCLSLLCQQLTALQTIALSKKIGKAILNIRDGRRRRDSSKSFVSASGFPELVFGLFLGETSPLLFHNL